MTWFLIALIGPFLYALTNHIDKILLEKYFKDGGVGTLMLFSSLLSALAIPFFYLVDPSVIKVSTINILVLAVVGILNILVLWCYLLALRNDEASVVVVFYQLVPLFGCILGYFFLGEKLTQIQLVAMALIILGTTLISFEIDSENNVKPRGKTILPMLAAAFFWALGSVIFKAVALEENLWRSLFWEHLMLLLVGIGIFLFIRPCRTSFLFALRNNSKAILSLNVANESLYILGNVAVAFAYMLAPIGLVLLAESYQPLFVLAIGVFLTVFFPNISAERIQAKHVWQKLISVGVAGIGTYLLLSSKP